MTGGKGFADGSGNRSRKAPAPLDPLLPVQELIRQGHQAAAVEALQRLLPQSFDAATSSQVRELLGALLLERQEVDPALPLLEEALRLSPGRASVLAALASAHRQRGQPERAIELLRQAIATAPRVGVLHYNLGNACWDAGLIEEAIGSFREALKLGFMEPEVFHHLALGLLELGRPQEAVQVVRAGLDRFPGHRELSFTLAAEQAERLDYAAALATLQAVPADPGDAQLLINLGITLHGIGRDEEAEHLLRECLACDATLAAAWSALGEVQQATGHLREAVCSYDRALALEPGAAETHRRRSVCVTYRADCEHLAQMRRLFLEPDLPEADRLRLAFALGKAEEDIGNHRAAFALFQLGNRLMRRKVPFELAPWYRETMDLLRLDALLRAGGQAVADTRKGEGLVFLVGMPRSGSTLTESILSLAPEAMDLGEHPALQRVVRAHLAGITEAEGLGASDLERIGDAYLGSLPKACGPGSLVSDKNLYNFRYVGLILRALPGVRVIHCVRNPVDNVLSIYKTFFPKGNEYACDLDAIFQFYQLQDQAMQHYQMHYPQQILRSVYDELAEDPAGRIPELIAFCGLTWQPCYLHPERKQRIVRTASAVQVRQPIHARSVLGWKRYETELAAVAQRFRDLGYAVD